ncbi:hypothetical protein B0H13DRAFT_2333474 [Mycena leptocephala]|nr:hypothetical protein B0H13DRAFT_2333474 [Mycena leptocephala]
MPENRAIAKKLLAWAVAVVPHSITTQDEGSGSLWSAKTPPRSSHNARSSRTRAERIHHKLAMKILYLLFLLCLLVAPVFCESTCPRSFDNLRELRIHQKACKIFQNAQAMRDKQAMSGESALELRARKRRRREVTQAQPEQSTSSASSIQEPPDVEMDRPPSPPQLQLLLEVRTKRKTWKLLQQLPEPAPAVLPPQPEDDPEPEVPAPDAPPTWWTGSQNKLIEQMEKLVGVLKDPKFSKEDVMDFDVKRETARFDENLSGNTTTVRDGWKFVSVDIPIPDGKKHASEADAPVFSVPGLFYRPLVEVIKGSIRDVGDRGFHYTPLKQFWTPSSDSELQRVYDEIYSSEAMVELPDAFHDFFETLAGHAPSAEVLTHCRRELMHDICSLLLDEEFLATYEHGIVIECEDGVLRRFYPRIFTHSADYPEKVLLATIRNLGKAPCPHCYIPKTDFSDHGTIRDEKKRETLARTDDHVNNGILTRIRNWIYQTGRNAHMIFGNNAITRPNRRFRLIPTFGRSTIRRFIQSTSALKKLAACNYQCKLLCCIPVGEGLLPEPYNSEVIDVLFILAEWHTLAKLKLHTPTAKGGKGKAPAKTSPKKKEYNLEIYKLHSIGDYVSSILWFGTSDSYSTQPGELEHRRVKRFYARTNKNRAVRQMTMLERRETALLRMAGRAHKKALHFGKTTSTPVPQGYKQRLKKAQTYVPFAESEALPCTRPDQHHHISPSRNTSLHLSSWLGKSGDDPATKDFLPKLQEHLLSRLEHPGWSGEGNEFTAGQRYQLSLKNHRMYVHKILRLNYTTYDVRRGQDFMNPRTHSDVMYLAPEDDASHPFSYAQIIGIFHADVVNTAPGANPIPQSMEFPWVRRYRLDRTLRAGFKRKLIHGSHVVPAFAYGRTEELLSNGSIGRLPRDGLTENEDWRYYYVNFFVDRNIYMRYRGGGVGHYRVDLPEEDDVPEEDSEEEGDDGEPDPIITDPEIPPTPPRTPDLGNVPLLEDRPG